MKLETIHNGSIYASGCSDLFEEEQDLQFKQLSRLPHLESKAHSKKIILQHYCWSKKFIGYLFGAYPSVNLWMESHDQLYVSQGDMLFRSSDAGAFWDLIYRLPSSSPPMGILPSGFCITEDYIYLGEYPLDDSEQPRILSSNNRGDSWKTIAKPPVRHIHTITVDPFTSDRWFTTGDTDKQSMIGRISDTGMDIIGEGSQLWRAVDLTFTPDTILWGMDSPTSEENLILKLERDQIGKHNPSPEILYRTSSPVYYSDSLLIEGEYHVFFSTAIEPATQPDHTALVLHSSTADDFETWDCLAEYTRNTRPLSKHLDINTYVFLTTHPERGLFINPYNTNTDHGSILNISIDQIRDFEG